MSKCPSPVSDLVGWVSSSWCEEVVVRRICTLRRRSGGRSPAVWSSCTHSSSEHSARQTGHYNIIKQSSIHISTANCTLPGLSCPQRSLHSLQSTAVQWMWDTRSESAMSSRQMLQLRHPSPAPATGPVAISVNVPVLVLELTVLEPRSDLYNIRLIFNSTY